MRSIAEAGEARLPTAGGGGRPAARLPAYSSRSGKGCFLLPRPAAFSHKSAKIKYELYYSIKILLYSPLPAAFITSSANRLMSSRVSSSPARRRSCAAPRTPLMYQPQCFLASWLATRSPL